MGFESSCGRRLRRLVCGALLLSALALVVSGLLLPSFAMPAARAASLADDVSGKVAVFEDVTVGPGETRDTVVVVGGDVVIHGTVQNVVVVVGGDVVVASDGRVGVGVGRAADDAAVVSVLGDLVVEQGAVVSGRIVDVGGGDAGAVRAMVVDPVMRPWNDWDSIAGWIGSTVFIILVAVLIAAIAPRQLVFVSERARRHLFSSLGWGALGLIVIVPLASVLLIVTVIGILVLLPWWLAVIVALLFGYVGVGTLIGRLVIGKSEQRGRVILAAMVGVAVLSIVRWIPLAGSVVVFLALLVGLGATFTAIWEWRRRQRVGKGEAPQSFGAGAPYGAPYGDAGGTGAWPPQPPGNQPPVA